LTLGIKGINHPAYPMPEWVVTLEMSETWGIPPWQVEDEASQYWVERFLFYRSEIAKERKRQSDKANR
jgi:hypothetical protein